jgi:hypothetical protein
LNRLEKILYNLDTTELRGAEIGALDKPITDPRSENIIYVDYADTHFLQQKYADDPHVNIRNVVSVTAIWGKRRLIEALSGQAVDYVIASHVVEHVPDLITWLAEIHESLNEDGQLRLAVPDKRFTFDILRRETNLSDIIAAYIVGARRPQAREISDHLMSAALVDCLTIWRGECDRKELKPVFSLSGAIALAKEVMASDGYFDVHCWVFSPESFAELMAECAKAGLIKFRCSKFFDCMRKEEETEIAAASWAEMAKGCQSYSAVDNSNCSIVS